MEENKMQEFSQIRERFLADARQHFLASDAMTEQAPGAAGMNIEQCRSGAGELRRGPTGV